MERCSLCPGINNCLPPDGSQAKGGILLIGEAPGISENKQGCVFIGKTGEELNRHYLPVAGLARHSVCVTNAIRCYPISSGGKLDPNRTKDLALLESCAAAHLYPLIERMKPRVIVPMGAFACRAVCPDISLDIQHGMPTETAWGIPAFPSFHPSLGMHSPKQMLYIRTDWLRLKQYLAGTLPTYTDPYPNPDYAEVLDADDITSGLDPERPLAADTESSREGPFCLTYSQHGGTGRLIRADRHDLLDAFNIKLRLWRRPILFHNWLYDWPIVETMGLQFPIKHVVDTMARVYQLGNLPQGLKALGRRELGVQMQDFDDLVTPYSAQVVLRYLRLAYAEDWEKPEPQMVRDPSGKWKIYKAQSLTTKLKRFFTDLSKQPNKDIFGAWDNWESSHAEIEAVMGPWPGKDIRHVPFEQVLPYACRDADVLIRLWPVIQGMGRQVRKAPQDQWRQLVRVA